MDFLLNLFQNAVTLFVTVFVTACANELAKKLSSKRKRTALSHMNWTQKVGHIFKQLIRIELCIVQGAILL
ncbi:TPA: hypothetical protein ACGXKU_006345, partial [Bacillus cereus]